MKIQDFDAFQRDPLIKRLSKGMLKTKQRQMNVLECARQQATVKWAWWVWHKMGLILSKMNLNFGNTQFDKRMNL